MSDHPRTDALDTALEPLAESITSENWQQNVTRIVSELLLHSGQLERELAAATAERDEAVKQLEFARDVHNDHYKRISASLNAASAAWDEERQRAEREGKRVAVLRNALQRIRNLDYRGNRPLSADIADEALKP